MRESPTNKRLRESRFFIAIALFMALVVFIGFSRSLFLPFILPPDPLASTDAIYYAHGSISAAWIALFVIQPVLIRKGFIQQHRKLGSVGVGLAILVVLLGFWAALDSAARHPNNPLPATELDFLGVITFNLLMYGVLVGFAVALRRDGASHKRLMYLATLNMLQPAIVRLPFEFVTASGPLTSFWLGSAMVLPLVVWDAAVFRRLHPATLWAGLAIVFSIPFRQWLTGTSTWLGVAQWAVDLYR